MNKFSELIAKLSKILQIDQTELDLDIICTLKLRQFENESLKRMVEEA